MPATVRQLFTRITGGEPALTRDNVKKFVEAAGVESSFFMDKSGMAADSVMDTFDKKGTGAVTWDQFRGSALALVPPAMVGKLTAKNLTHEIDKQWPLLDPKGTGAASMQTITKLLEKEIAKAGESFPGIRAEVSARILMHALDENGDKKLQRTELEGFLHDVLAETHRAP